MLSPGTEVGAAPGAPGIFPGGLGLAPGACSGAEVDALSYGFDDPFGLPGLIYFSVDEFAAGDGLLPFSLANVTSEGALGATEASADVFAYRGVVAPTAPIAPPALLPFGNTAHEDGDGIAPSGKPGSCPWNTATRLPANERKVGASSGTATPTECR